MLLLSGALFACGGSDEQRAQETGNDSAAEVAADTIWPQSIAEPISLRRSREIDFTRDGRDERIDVTAHGPGYDSLDIAFVIVGADGDTLWREAWKSIDYFKYDNIHANAPDSVAHIVQANVDTLLHDSRFGMMGGLPAPLRRSSTPPENSMREAIKYHLAELDWRRAVGLRPSQPTPPAGYSVINDTTVTRERADSVLREVTAHPSFMYYAGGEATYAITWSGIEQAFVRIYSCC